MFHRTERLFLRPAWPEDWEELYSGIADEKVVRNLATAPWPYTREDAQWFTEKGQNQHMPSFMVTLPGEGLIGGAGMGIDEETEQLQMGYWIARDWWGHGFATEAASAVLQVAKGLGHKRITASHFVDNPASGRVLIKVGFQSTGLIRPAYSLARGRRDPVACFEARLSADDDDGEGDALSEMRKAA